MPAQNRQPPWPPRPPATHRTRKSPRRHRRPFPHARPLNPRPRPNTSQRRSRMPRVVRPKGAATASDVTWLWAAGGLITATVGAWVPVLVTQPPGDTSGGPVAVVIGLVTGGITWTTACTLWL